MLAIQQNTRISAEKILRWFASGRIRGLSSCRPCEIVVLHWSHFQDVCIATETIHVVRLRQYLEQHLKTIGMLVHLRLLLKVLCLLFVNELLDALKLCKVLLLVFLNQHLKPLLHGFDFASHLFLWLFTSLLKLLKLLPFIVFLCEQILNHFSLLCNIWIDFAKIVK